VRHLTYHIAQHHIPEDLNLDSASHFQYYFPLSFTWSITGHACHCCKSTNTQTHTLPTQVTSVENYSVSHTPHSTRDFNSCSPG